MINNTASLSTSITSTSQQQNQRYRSESNIKFDLSKLIDALGYGPVESEHAIGDGFTTLPRAE